MNYNMESVNDLIFTLSLAILLSFIVSKLLSISMNHSSLQDSDFKSSLIHVRSNLGTILSIKESTVNDVITSDDPPINETVAQHAALSRSNLVTSYCIGESSAHDVITTQATPMEYKIHESLHGSAADRSNLGSVGVSDVIASGVGYIVRESSGRIDEYFEESLAVRSSLGTIHGIDGSSVYECSEKLHEAEEITREFKLGLRDKLSLSECLATEKEVESTVGDETEDHEDDWEGIERSNLDPIFSLATKFVSEKLVNVNSELEMKFYGLQKVSLEGPCYEPQPMALKVSARAKWNSWQNLGNMSPDEAMEKYIALLSEIVPGWMADSSAGSISDVVLPDKSNLPTSLHNHTKCENESDVGLNDGIMGSDLGEIKHEHGTKITVTITPL